jgi:hypothetical protein
MVKYAEEKTYKHTFRYLESRAKEGGIRSSVIEFGRKMYEEGLFTIRERPDFMAPYDVKVCEVELKFYHIQDEKKQDEHDLYFGEELTIKA